MMFWSIIKIETNYNIFPYLKNRNMTQKITDEFKIVLKNKNAFFLRVLLTPDVLTNIWIDGDIVKHVAVKI